MNDVLIFLVFGPPLWFLAGMLGRRAQREMWKMHLPYEERVRLLRGKK